MKRKAPSAAAPIDAGPTRAELEQALSMLAAQGVDPPKELLAHLEELKAAEREATEAGKPAPKASAPRVIRG